MPVPIALEVTMRLRSLILSSLLFACDKPSAEPAKPLAPAPSTSTSTSTASVATNDAPAASAVPSLPSAVAEATALAPAPKAGTPEIAKDAGAAKATAASALKPASKHVAGKNFSLDLASPGCRIGVDCALTIKLVAVGEFHVNKEYPYKFVASAAPGVEFLGKGPVTAFTRAAGDFVEQGEKSGTMTVRFKPSTAGEARVAGVYKFSVCSGDQCQIEQEPVELAVPVL